MYHSHLLINIGDNPDRPDWKICRRWLRNLYRVHQRLCMAFPSAAPVENRKAEYCKPFTPSSFGSLQNLPDEHSGHVHTPRSNGGGFLFRIDYPVDFKQGLRKPVILVQSAEKPDWDYAFGLNETARSEPPFGNADFLLAARPEPIQVSIRLDGSQLLLESPKQDWRLKQGDTVRFRLRANPTRKIKNGAKNGARKRVKPSHEVHFEWLRRKLGDAAEFPNGIENLTNLATGWSYGWRSKYEPEQPSKRMQWWSVLFEGTFRVKDTTALENALITGIGPAKAFGFGLLSIAPV